MGRRKGKSPKQSARARLMARHGLKGGHANIWLTVCPRSGQQLAFSGDARSDHFYAVEGDPDIRAASYSPPAVTVTIDGQVREVRFDARLELQDGTIEFRSVVPDPEADESEAHARRVAAAQHGATYRAISLSNLDALSMRISNWRRALRHLRACSHFVLGENEAAVMYQLTQSKQLTIRELLHALPLLDQALVVGAIVSLLHKRQLRADLDRQIWSLHTVVSLPDADS